ncbi:hypothetical protein [Pseudomonas mandelii]|jgi:hypothetical protein|uniref:hypothetical protein n=1 Tax=Pseudomonas mandelii TaxID=75612 RepID=UPI00029A2DB6|nr:hypothetical protein [Pseudomonas mandelii]MDZ4328604.1 hypothetical protein [Pseudomonas sp.]
MKRYLRLYLVFLLSLALPLSGMAGIQLQADRCPMKTAGMGKMGQNCCHDMNSFSNPGKPCKTGQECKTGSVLQVSIVKIPVIRSAPLVVSFFHDFLLAQAPSEVWRPPRV